MELRGSWIPTDLLTLVLYELPMPAQQRCKRVCRAFLRAVPRVPKPPPPPPWYWNQLWASGSFLEHGAGWEHDPKLQQQLLTDHQTFIFQCRQTFYDIGYYPNYTLLVEENARKRANLHKKRRALNGRADLPPPEYINLS